MFNLFQFIRNAQVEIEHSQLREVYNQVSSEFSDLDTKYKTITNLLPKYFILNGLVCDGDVSRCLVNLFERDRVKTLTFPVSGPSPLAWSEGNVQLTLREVSVGFFTVGDRRQESHVGPKMRLGSDYHWDKPSFKMTGGNYRDGDEVYALVLDISMKTGPSGGGKDGGDNVPLNIRRVVDKLGTLFQPDTHRYLEASGPWGQYLKANTEIHHRMVWFVVSPKETEFLLTTGGDSNIFFEIFIEPTGKLTFRKTERTKL